MPRDLPAEGYRSDAAKYFSSPFLLTLAILFPHNLVFLPACFSYSSALAIMLHGNTVRLLAGAFLTPGRQPPSQLRGGEG